MSSPPTISTNYSLQLPIELVQDVLCRISRKDIKNVRLVSKTLAKAAAPFCFDSIFLSVDPLDLEKAKYVLNSFTSMIKTLIIPPLRYANLGEAIYGECVQALGRLGHSEATYKQIKKHIKQGYKDYSSLQERSSHSRAQQEMLTCLRVALETSPNLKEVVLTHRRRYTELTGLELAKFCSVEECDFPVETHALLRLSPHQSHLGLDSPDVSDASSSIIMFGGSRTRELIMEPGGTPFVRFQVRMESDFAALFPVTACRDVTNFMSSLTRLRFGLDTYWIPNPRRKRMMASMLAHARELEYLFLDGLLGYLHDPAKPTESSFHYMLHGCGFPKLRVFVLGNSAMDGDELLPLLNYWPLLKRLVIDDCLLRGHRWEYLIEGIKLNTRLDDLFMDALWEAEYGPQGDEKLLYYADCAGDINDFVFHDRPNPFSVEDRKRYKDMWWSDRRYRESSMRVKEYYERYF